MDAIANPVTSSIKAQVRPSELLSLLDQLDNQIKVLSLDCFDTIIWRKTTSAIDAFYDMHQKPHFKALNLSANLRASIEVDARRNMLFQHGKTEVALKDIYKAGFPFLSEDQIKALMKEEIETEHEVCYAFPPLIELIRAAHHRGLKIVIVSDTYFTEKQLRHLLEKKLPEDVMKAINAIYCSCEHDRSKHDGLLQIVAKKLNSVSHEILHIGDSQVSDYHAAQKAGMHASQLIAYDSLIGDMLRMQILSLSLLDPSIRHSRGLYSPFRGLFSASDIDIKSAKTLIGYVGLGPIMYCFAKFIQEEVSVLESENKRVKVLYLMRDAHLPALVCDTISGKESGYRVRISRFAAYAASFRSRKDVEHYLATQGSDNRLHDLARQLLIPESIATSIIKKAEKNEKPLRSFIQEVLEPKNLNIILAESKKYSQRLQKYLIKETQLEKGDTLVFVDLGYSGTAQRLLQPVFESELGVHVVGRYLIQLNTPNWQATRKGLIDSSWCDERVMNLMVKYVALLEQLCTSTDRSIIDYDDAGNPIYSDASVGKNQHEKLIPIQSECVRFAQEADLFFKNAQTTISSRNMRDIAAGALIRLIFLPAKEELQYLQSFQFDLNLGTNDLLKVFDEKAGLEGLRKRGLFFMEYNLKSMRTNYPAELRSAGLELALTLMTQLRYGVTLLANDFNYREDQLEVVVMVNQQSSQTILTAKPTHDGYYSLLIPIGTGGIQVGIIFGKKYQWIQLDSAELIKTVALFTSNESENTTDASTHLAVDQMQDKGGGLFECLTDSAMLAFVPPVNLGTDNLALRIVYRPIVERQ